MDQLAKQGELSLARDLAKCEAEKAREEAKAAAIEKEFQANERERQLLRQEREQVREERMAQRDRDIMKEPLEEKSPNSKYFWKSEKADVVRMRREKEGRTSGHGPSTTRQDHPSTTNWLGDDDDGCTKSIILLHKVRIMVANSNHDFVEQMSFHSKTTSKVRIRECRVTNKIIVQEIYTSSLPACIKVSRTVGPADLSHSLDDLTGM